ncbi:hypothetical protein HaLaN_16147 [Haematococcus lacustris]|uniref:Uncharacterized protein n=1 Tax=Haematococcus lacustris TaxID=44745 RepID=A0A699Z9D1_HAELA|nr:hypothetical protein HaLaN_16147 [Haematococcus lacustris]
MSLVAQCLRGSGPVPRSKSRFRLKVRENEVLASLQANNARSEGLNGKPSDDRCAPPPCMPPHCLRHQSPGWRRAARVQEDVAQAKGAPPVEG